MARSGKISGNNASLLEQAKAALQRGDLSAAEKQLSDVLRAGDRNEEALTLLARVQMQQGRLEQASALFEEILLLNPENPLCLNALGSILFSLKRYDESEQRFRRALQLAPGFVDATGNLGLACQHLGKHEEALRRLQTAVRNGGATAKTMLALGKELIHQLQPVKAKAVLSRLVQNAPENVEALAMLGVATGDCGDMKEAESCWRKAEKLGPENAEPAACRARALQNLGDMEGAIGELERALDLNPQHAGALFAWAHVAEGNPSNTLKRSAVLEMISAALSRPEVSHEDRVQLGFAAGKLLDSAKDHTGAVGHYIQANGQVWQVSSVKKEMYRAWHDRLLSTFDEAFFNLNAAASNRRAEGNDRCGEGLVFIVGMPRSGTTLIEQILSRDDRVTPGGERPDIDVLAGNLLDHMDKQARTGSGTSLDLAFVRQLASQHHANVSRLAHRDGVFTDKSPRNFMNLGVIATLFPKARIIHCVRNPVDTCLSCYFNHFGFNAVAYSYDQETLGYFHSLYAGMMDHWRKVLPMDVHDAVYEDIVGEPDRAIRALTSFCGLDWNDKFLHPEDSDRTANTASLAQVKKPIYKGSVERWLPYADHIIPLLDALGIDHPG